MADQNFEDMVREASETLRQMSDDLKKYGYVRTQVEEAYQKAQQKLIAATNANSQAQQNASKNVDQAGRHTGRALTNLADAGMGAASAMLQGQKGATAFNRSLDNMSQAATAAAAALYFLIPGGPLIKGLVTGLSLAASGLTAFTKAANEMADQLYKGYAGLAKSGAAASDGMTGLFEDAKRLGMSMAELGDLTSIIGSRSGDMALFGGAVFEGRKRLAQLGQELEGSREYFYALGMSAQDVMESNLDYIRTQRIVGTTNNMTAEQLAQGAKKYLEEQDALTKLTGMARKEQEAAREEIRSQERFAAKLEELRQQGRTKEAKALEDTFLILRSQSREAAQGFADISTNNLQTEAAQKSFMATQGESMRVAQRISRGQMDAAQGAQVIAQRHGATAERLGVTLGQLGTYNQTYGDLAADLRLRGLAEQDITKVLAKIEEDRAKLADKESKEGDVMLNQQAKLLDTQRQANEATERFVKAGILPAQQAMQKLAEITRDSTDAISRAFGIDPMAAQGGSEQAKMEMQDQANWAAATLEEKISSGLARGVEAAGRTISGLVGTVSDTAKDAVDSLVDKAKAERIRSETQYLEDKGAIPSGSTRSIEAPPSGPDGGASAGGAAGTQAPAPKAERTGYTEDDLRKMGLTIKEGATHAAGRNIEQKALDVAQVAQRLSGFSRITGFNDAYHRGGTSLHGQGRAFDFTLEKPPTRQQSDEIIRSLMSAGASKVLDEYRNPSRRATGPHFHVEVPAMARGGITQGISIAGEAGPEAVVPLPDGKTIPVSIKGLEIENLLSGMGKLVGQIRTATDDDLDRTKQQQMSRSIADATGKAIVSGFDKVFDSKNWQSLFDFPQMFMAKGGITQGPSVAGEAGPEAVVPLPDGKTIPVTVDLKDWQQTGPTFAGYNEYRGYNSESLTTDLAALKDIAGSLGAFDKATETITNPAVWKEILHSGLLNNVDLGAVTVGSKMAGPEIGIEIGDRIKEVMTEQRSDLPTALAQVKTEFMSAMQEVIKSMQTQTDPSIQIKILETLSAMNRNTAATASASEKMVQVAMN